MQGEDLTVSVLPLRNLLAAVYAWLTRTECVGEWQAGPPGYVGGWVVPRRRRGRAETVKLRPLPG